MADWGAGAKGALGGAATGATVGSVIPGVGTAIGAGVGGLLGGLGGLFGGGSKAKAATFQDRDRILELINQGYGRGGITQQRAPQLQLGADPFRASQLQQLGQLQGIASGQQQGAGELAAQRQYQNALAAQQAQARLARGGNAALAYRNAANQSAALGSSAAGAGQQAALTDQLNAQGLLGQLGSAGRQADINVAGQNAANQLGVQQLNSQNYLSLLNQLSGMNAAQLAGQNAANAANAQQSGALLGGLLNVGGQILGSRLQRGS